MEVLTRTNGREMTLAISGELDHHGAHGAMQQIDHALDAALPLSMRLKKSWRVLNGDFLHKLLIFSIFNMSFDS